MERACTWDQPPSNIPADAWQRLSTLYDSPSDIDLFTAGLLEDLLPGANVGATFGCLIGGQFKKLKFGDRFFFTHNPKANSGSISGRVPDPANENPNPFTQRQLVNLRNRHLGDIICDNTKIPATRLNVFQFNSELVVCDHRSRGGNTRLNTDLFI